jgi:tungstate transport system ATP-binding protein
MTLDHADARYALEAKGLTVVLGGHQVLNVPSLQMNPNETLIIIGPNGSGKTTFLLCLAMLLEPEEGVVFYRGVPVRDTKHVLRQRRKLAVVFQDPLLLNSSVWDNVTLGLRLRGVNSHEASTRAWNWLERFGISHLAKRQARKLSGGEAKRVSLARAFVLQPEVLFMDEPFSSLDAPTRQSLLEEFETVLSDTKTTTVIVTHDRNEALVLADRIAVVIDGSIHQIGTPEEVLGSPVNEEVANFVEAGNIYHGIVNSDGHGLTEIDIEGKKIQAVSNLQSGTPVTTYLHYDDVTIHLPPTEPIFSSARNQFRGIITKAFPVGSQLKVTIDCGFPLASIITRRSWEELNLEKGSEVIASFKASALHLIPRKTAGP